MNDKENILPIGNAVRSRKDTTTLRIKKVYFDQIKSGVKTFEYRDFTPFYKKLFKKLPAFIYLHYQGNNGLVCEVKKIKVVKTPKILKESKIKFSDEVFKIQLGGVREVCNA